MTTITIQEYLKILNLDDNFLKSSKEGQKQALSVAWKKFVLAYHPDLNKDNSECEEIFKKGNEAREKILEYIENVTTQTRKEHNSSKSNGNYDEFDDAIKEFFKEFEEGQKRKKEAEKQKEKEILFKILGIIGIIAIIAISILGLPLTLLIVANFLIGKLKQIA